MMKVGVLWKLNGEEEGELEALMNQIYKFENHVEDWAGQIGIVEAAELSEWRPLLLESRELIPDT